MACRVASIVVVAVFLLVQAVAEEPKPCCWISQMYGACMVQEDKELEDGTIVVEDTLAEFAYDKTFSAKAFIFTETFENGTQLIARIVELSDLGIAYFIQDNQGQTKCSKKRIPARFKPNCVPEAARFWSNATLGDHALNGNIWERNKFEDGLLTNTTYLMAADYCVPLSVNHVVYNLNPSPPESGCHDAVHGEEAETTSDDGDALPSGHTHVISKLGNVRYIKPRMSFLY
ncbi:uncharacterized protein LOC119737743 isoform X2 [Patiria miniata]|uniref:Uncharacterized protein n=1 Tax=Patiria miniata TaxID=46514 RepID=A0A914AXI6_PATMI|nr:uncharacterized protein LOC119737743 isoform X2 [Patiria miniata]